MHWLLGAACFCRPKVTAGLDLGQAVAWQGQGRQEVAERTDGYPTGQGRWRKMVVNSVT